MFHRLDEVDIEGHHGGERLAFGNAVQRDGQRFVLVVQLAEPAQPDVHRGFVTIGIAAITLVVAVAVRTHDEETEVEAQRIGRATAGILVPSQSG